MQLLKVIAQRHGLPLEGYEPLHGGDINAVYRLNCGPQNYVIKINDARAFPAMFEAEKAGLEQLGATSTFRIPSVIAHGVEVDTAYIILEYIKEGVANKLFWSEFGVKLASLHKQSNDSFGNHISNYIGSLPQSNGWEESASEFYIHQRLRPQFDLAKGRGYGFGDLTPFYNTVSNIIPDEPSALVHGDLWSGNYLVSDQGEPVLIDPAVAYSIREMDLAMMQLFGGFPVDVFTSYNEAFPLQPDWKDRVPLWQLYYLLVHLNLFGAGYLGQVQSILKRYL